MKTFSSPALARWGAIAAEYRGLAVVFALFTQNDCLFAPIPLHFFVRPSG